MAKSYSKLLSTLLSATLIFATADAQFQTLGTYNSNGKPNYLVTPSDVVTNDFRTRINNTLPETRPVPTYSPRLISDTVPETIQANCNIDVWVSFVYEGASYRNVLGFYTFTGNTPASAPANNQVTLIFPNASRTGDGGELNAGDKVFLGNFPSGTKIAFVLFSNGWNGSAPTVGNGAIWSISSWNTAVADPTKRKHMVMVTDSVTNRIVLGFEDIRRDLGGDQDFNDCLFYVTTNPNTCDNRSNIPVLNPNGSIVYSGNTGGVESKSLGDIIGKRNYNKAINNEFGSIDYQRFTELPSTGKMQMLTSTDASNNVAGALSLSELMPARMLDPGYKLYLTSPTDLTGFTNAKEVISIDFTQNNECKAVAFATKTSGEVYNHTKPVCDRLRGAELIGMENFTLNGLDFVRYTLKRENGAIEFATSFSVGMKNGRNSYTFQSNWLNQNYQNDEVMYNFQLWAAAPHLVTDMMIDVLDKLNSSMKVQQIKVAGLPQTYVLAGKRAGNTLNLRINNTTSATTAYLEMAEKANEKAAVSKRLIPVTLNAKGQTQVAVPVGDFYETDIKVYVNGKLEDALYMADGGWGIDYNSTTTSLNRFAVVNNDTRKYGDEYPLLRNAEFNASTKDFVTLYKILAGGATEQDLTAYNQLKFSATGTGTLRVTLVKKSITDWNKQYSYAVALTNSKKDYTLNLIDFAANGTKDKINPNDIAQVVFSFEVNGKQTSLTGGIYDAAFVKGAVATPENKDAKELRIYPNPANGIFKIGFEANTAAPATIRITDAATGRSLFEKTITTVEGNNVVDVDLTKTIAPQQMIGIINVNGTSVRYKAAKIVVNR
jgi:hypothetical protein